MADNADQKGSRRDKFKKSHHQIRFLAFVLTVFLGVAAVILIYVSVTTIGKDDPNKYDISLTFEGPKDNETAEDKNKRDNVRLLVGVTAMSGIGFLASFLLLIASCMHSVFLVFPFFLYLVGLLILYLYELFYHGLCIGKCNKVTDIIDSPTDTSSMAWNAMREGGASYIFSALIIIPVILHMFIVAFVFVMDCCDKRKGKGQQQQQQQPQGEVQQAGSGTNSPPPAVKSGGVAA